MTGKQVTTADAALLVAYADGDLSLAEAVALEQRLATEPDLAAALRELVAAEDLGQQLGSAGLLTAARPPSPGRPRRRGWLWLGLALAAVAAAVAGAL